MYYMISTDYLYQKIVQMIKPDATHYPIETYDKVIKELMGMRNTSRVNRRLSDTMNERQIPQIPIKYSPPKPTTTTTRPSISPKQLYINILLLLLFFRTPVIADNVINFNDSVQPPYRSTRSSLSPSSGEESFRRSTSNRSSLV